MFAKLIVLAVCATAALAGGAAKYPAGVNPALCPNYPHCDNVALHGLYGQAAHHAVAHYAAPAHQPAQYPAGVHPSTCPNYPYCSTYAPAHPAVHHAAPAYYAAPAHHAAYYHHAAPAVHHLPAVHAGPAKEWPAGVHPAACPNYPYCH